jgi:glycosyltransferase involved in cell wall biosynthesis
VVYKENETNKGLGYSMALGVETCTNEIIFRMDSDDVMVTDRLKKQLNFMKTTPDCVICGTQIQCFNNKNEIVQVTKHPFEITLAAYKTNPSHWFLNHPSVCFKKSAILEVGNYNDGIHSMMEDFDLWLRILKRYGKIYNIQEVLLNYRIHEKQLTFKGGEKGPEFWHNQRVEKIKQILKQ